MVTGAVLRFARKAALVGACAVTLGLVGCSPPPPPELADLQVADDTALGDAIAAFSLSRQSVDFIGGTSTGFIGLIDADGTLRTIRTAGMDNGQLDWSAAGLVFADVGDDYHLAETLTRIESPKTNLQQAIFAADDGGTLGLYNDGFTDDGYASQLVTTKSGHAVLDEVQGNYLVTGLCDGRIVGLSEPTGPYAAQAEASGIPMLGDFEFRSQMLSRIGTAPDGREEVVAIAETDEGSQFASDAPCADGKLVHLATLRPDLHSQVPVVRVWEIATGALEQHEIRLAKGVQSLVNDDLGFEFDGYTRASLRGGQLDWVAIDGRVMSTDTTTGMTTERFTLADDGYDPKNPLRAIEFTASTLQVLTVDTASGIARFVIYDRDNGDETVRFDIPGVAEAVDSGIVLRDLAVAPE